MVAAVSGNHGCAQELRIHRLEGKITTTERDITSVMADLHAAQTRIDSNVAMLGEQVGRINLQLEQLEAMSKMLQGIAEKVRAGEKKRSR